MPCFVLWVKLAIQEKILSKAAMSSNYIVCSLPSVGSVHVAVDVSVSVAVVVSVHVAVRASLHLKLQVFHHEGQTTGQA